MDYRSIQNETIELLLDYGISEIPIDIEKLMNKMHIIRVPYNSLIYRAEELASKMTKDGFYIFDHKKNLFYIYYNSCKTYKRIKFTYGHEIRHIVHMDKYEDEAIRVEANYFSRFLIVPIPLLIEIGIKNENELIEIFDVSPDVANHSIEFLEHHRVEYLNYTENEMEFLELFENEINRCKKNLIELRNRLKYPEYDYLP